jgi:group I intron endonuclease
MIIYKTTNLINGKFYVGKDEKNSPSYLGSGLNLKKAIKKYGVENFKKEILEECLTRDELNNREKYWINELSAITVGYNISEGGSGGDTYSNNPNLSEIIKKISGKNNHFFNKNHSHSSKEKMSKSQKGRTAWNKGMTKIYSEETKEKMRKARVAFTGDNASNFIKIDNDELILCLEKNTINETAKYFNISVSCIREKIKFFNINYSNIKDKKTTVSHNYYEINESLFLKILEDRKNFKLSIEELAKKYNIGINKLRKEFKNKNIQITRIK